jgi:hypothetical protein
VVKALWGQGLLPRVISGASAGSIVTALVGYVDTIYKHDDNNDVDDCGDGLLFCIHFPSTMLSSLYFYPTQYRCFIHLPLLLFRTRTDEELKDLFLPESELVSVPKGNFSIDFMIF